MGLVTGRGFDEHRRVASSPVFKEVAACLGDGTRAAMLDALMDGRAHTATELAAHGEVTPPTASSHLARLVTAGLLEVVKQGRHRYYRLASPEVAAALEQLMGLGTQVAPQRGPTDSRLRRARICYDHLAGQVAVIAFSKMWARGFLEGSDFEFVLSEQGREWCEQVGLSLDELEATSRPLHRACLDWSERRPHLAGGLGAALFRRLRDWRFVEADLNGRAVSISLAGQHFLTTLQPPPRAT